MGGLGTVVGERARLPELRLPPGFRPRGTPGYGRFYTWTDTEDKRPAADFTPGGGRHSHHTVLLEWRAHDASATTYDGGEPRELLRFEQPFSNHNGGHAVFDPLAAPVTPTSGCSTSAWRTEGAGAIR